MPPKILYSVLGGTGCFPNYGEEPMAMRFGVCIPSQFVCLWLMILLKQYSMVPLVVLHLPCDIDDKRTSWPLF